jgi:hypothetical protein
MGYFVGGDTPDEWGQLMSQMFSGMQGGTPQEGTPGEGIVDPNSASPPAPVSSESVAPKTGMGQVEEFFKNPGWMSVLARTGSILSGKNTPMGQFGQMTADVGKGLQMNEAMKKMLGPYLKAAAGGGVGPGGVGTGTGTESKGSSLGPSTTSQPGLSSSGAVGLDASELQKAYGDTAKISGDAQTREVQKITSLAHLITAKAALDMMPTEKRLKEAHATYYEDTAKKLAQEAAAAAKTRETWDTWRSNPMTVEQLKAMGLNPAAISSIISADHKTGMTELAKYGLEQYKEDVKTNVLTPGSGLYKKGKKIAEQPKDDNAGDKGWINTDAGNLAFGDIRKDVETDYITSLGKGKEKEGRQKLGQLFLDLQDPTKAASASSALYGSMSPATKEKFLKLKDAYAASKGKTGKWSNYRLFIDNPNPPAKEMLPGAPSAKPAVDTIPSNTDFDRANAENRARYLENKRPEFEAKLKGEKPGNYTFPLKTGPVEVYWDGKNIQFKISVPGGGK